MHNLVAWESTPWLEAERKAGASGGSASPTTRRPRSASSAGAAHAALRDGPAPAQPSRADGERELLPLAEELGVAVIVMRPFGPGAAARHAARTGGARAPARFGVETWPQALLKWALSDPRVDLVDPRDAGAAPARPKRGRRLAAVVRPRGAGARGRLAR